MKLLFLTNGYPPRHTAGTESYTAGLATALAQAGHSVSVICVGDWDSGPDAYNGVTHTLENGVAVSRLNLNWTRGPDPNRYLFDNPHTERFVAAVLDELSPDLVHITSCTTLSASVIRPVTARRLPLVVTLTDFWFFCPQFTLLRSDGRLCDGRTTAWECLRCLLGDAKAYRWPAAWLPEPVVAAGLTLASRTPGLSRRPGLRGMALDMDLRKQRLPALLEQADALIAPSRFLAETARGCGCEKPIRVSGYGHNLDWTAQLPPRAPLGQVRVGYVGRLTPVKGVHVLLAALARLGPNQAPAVHVYGRLDQEPAYTQALQRQAADLPNVTFHGAFARDQLAAVYSQIDVLVVPSLWYENNPLVVQEAFAAGVPVVASRLGGLAEFVTDQVNGWLFEPGDAAALADVLADIVARPDQVERLRAGRPPVRTLAEEVLTLTELYAERLK